jgi:hypothetical protein
MSPTQIFPKKRKPGWLARFVSASGWMRLHRNRGAGFGELHPVPVRTGSDTPASNPHVNPKPEFRRTNESARGVRCKSMATRRLHVSDLRKAANLLMLMRLRRPCPGIAVPRIWPGKHCSKFLHKIEIAGSGANEGRPPAILSRFRSLGGTAFQGVQLTNPNGPP